MVYIFSSAVLIIYNFHPDNREIVYEAIPTSLQYLVKYTSIPLTH